eukprot:TRINITY_DN1052_c0_g1_i2.p1 TRINITY_DN1052_c0_g1~~TRINITY_DN1052_c0_g1_i2.p1  ORF type:complete len:375 (-),score=78.17 TRINITY_DN1052_c0_g1_i2:1336-2460(-)
MVGRMSGLELGGVIETLVDHLQGKAKWWLLYKLGTACLTHGELEGASVALRSLEHRGQSDWTCGWLETLGQLARAVQMKESNDTDDYHRMLSSVRAAGSGDQDFTFQIAYVQLRVDILECLQSVQSALRLQQSDHRIVQKNVVSRLRAIEHALGSLKTMHFDIDKQSLCVLESERMAFNTCRQFLERCLDDTFETTAPPESCDHGRWTEVGKWTLELVNMNQGSDLTACECLQATEQMIALCRRVPGFVFDFRERTRVQLNVDSDIGDGQSVIVKKQGLLMDINGGVEGPGKDRASHCIVCINVVGSGGDDTGTETRHSAPVEHGLFRMSIAPDLQGDAGLWKVSVRTLLVDEEMQEWGVTGGNFTFDAMNDHK